MIQSANVTLMVRDFPAAVDFYSGALGFSVRMRAENDWCELEAPGLSLALHPTYGQPIEPGTAATLGFQVADIRAAIADLQAKGVSFASDVIDTGHLLLANFVDPEGNPMYLAQLPS
jgi:predicted enzyme related to lactoylglutathione lyase